MQKEYKSLCVIDSVYSLFLYVLYKKGEIQETLFIHSDSIPESISQRLPNRIYFPSFKNKRFSQLRRLIYCFHFLLFSKKKISKEIKIYAQDHLFFSFVFLRSKYNLLEDGLGNYVKHRKKASSRLRCLLMRGEEWGYNDKAHTILLTGLTDIPEKLLFKTTIIDMQAIWGNLDEVRKKYILDLFMLKESIINEKIGAIILTQPFSEEGVLSEIEKVSLYKSILSNYSGLIFIKPHPREVTNYEHYFEEDVRILPKNFPFQLLMLINPPERIISCFSTVGYSSSLSKVDRYGTEINDRLISRYGLIKSKFDGQ